MAILFSKWLLRVWIRAAWKQLFGENVFVSQWNFILSEIFRSGLVKTHHQCSVPFHYALPIQLLWDRQVLISVTVVNPGNSTDFCGIIFNLQIILQINRFLRNEFRNTEGVYWFHEKCQVVHRFQSHMKSLHNISRCITME